MGRGPPLRPRLPGARARGLVTAVSRTMSLLPGAPACAGGTAGVYRGGAGGGGEGWAGAVSEVRSAIAESIAAPCADEMASGPIWSLK
jgi:hypothetical protein